MAVVELRVGRYGAHVLVRDRRTQRKERTSVCSCCWLTFGKQELGHWHQNQWYQNPALSNEVKEVGH